VFTLLLPLSEAGQSRENAVGEEDGLVRSGGPAR
jgi:hypothetical protein